MIALFSDIPESLENSVEIAKRCNVSLTLGKNYLPRFPVPEGFTTETYLVDVARKGLDERLKVIANTGRNISREAYDARLQLELDVINKMGFAGYFLIVADFTRWARNNGVPVGPGRGSGPGSLVAFSLNITDLDPLALELLFERFLNPERVSMPDFDIDFCMEGRDRVIDYVMETHGRQSVSQIITYGTMAAKAVVRDVGRVLGMPYGFVDKIAKLIPFELGITLEKALEQEETLRERYNKEDEVRTLIDLALKLEGTTRNVGKHAGGVVIAPDKLTEFTPLYCEEDAPEHIVSQFDKDDVEAVGLVKFDFLGLRTLTIINWALQQINATRKIKGEEALDIHLLPMNDAITFSMLKACKTTAIFQLESRGMKELVKRLQPDCFDDIVALVALFRPGPLQSGMVDDFINRKHGRAKVIYPHPKLEPILRPTYGVILYQEQVMQIAQVLAGYSLGAADLLRRAMGKKKPEEMAEQRAIFCKGSVERGVDLDTATHIFDLMEKFAGYGFNKSHSASYALISYQTAWLKAHYAAPYMAAVLSSDMDHTDKVVHFVEECDALGLKIAPPDINYSDYMFKSLDEKNLVYGLGAIKGAGQAAIELIVAAREKDGLFKDLFDFCRRVDLRKVNRRVLEALIKAGAFDKIGPHRASIMASIDLALQQAEQTLRDQSVGQHDLFSTGSNEPVHQVEYVKVAVWNDQERLFGEKETLGLYLSGHPIHRYLKELDNFISMRIDEARPTQSKTVIIAGVITNVRSLQTKRGDRMAVVTLDDASGQIDMLCFSENYQKYRELLTKDKLIIVEGEISVDDFNDSYRMVCREIFSIEQARERYSKYLQIRVSPNKTDLIAKLSSILEKFRGGRCSILLDYMRQDAKANLRLGDAWRVRPSDALLQLLRETFEEENVEFVY
jgi:DNA polymerase-3 subunit alpha